MKRLAAIAAPLVLVAVLLAIWEAACRLLHVPAYFLPPPSEIGASLADNAALLLASAWRTLEMALLALVTASIVACALALITATSRTLERAVQPLAVVLQVTPVVAIAPLVVIWAGLAHPGRAVVALAAVVAFFPIFSGALTGLKAADPDLERLFDLYGATPAQKLARLRLPSAAPFLLEGHKVAAGLAIIGAVVAEFVAGSGGAQGLAWRILEAGNRLQTAKMFAALAVLGLLAALLNGAVQLIERRALSWWRGR
ncbi:MAG: ABC transporter permease [Parcubacteria group bacterium]